MNCKHPHLEFITEDEYPDPCYPNSRCYETIYKCHKCGKYIYITRKYETKELRVYDKDICDFVEVKP